MFGTWNADVPRNLRAFTLIELLIVVAIIGILAAIAIPNFAAARVRARVAQVKADIRAVVTALESYRIDHQAYPWRSETAILQPGARGRLESGLLVLTTPVAYITTLPLDAFREQSERFPRTFEYHSTTKERRSFSMNPEKPLPLIAYVIHSLGPDQLGNGISDAPFIGTQGPTYDPSNGLRSVGDIYWYGGDPSVMYNVTIDGISHKGRFPQNFR